MRQARSVTTPTFTPSAAGVTYTYDGGLRRVKKSSGTLYWYCATCGNVLAESDLSGNILSEYALFNGQRIARRDVSSGNIYYIFSDRLGSYRTLTDATGNVKGESDYYPFGGERVISSTVTESFRFAGMEWDSEDGLNHTLYRKYTPAQGRWESPDPKRGCVSFPQGHNLYAYVKDNATNLVDPLGDIVMCGQGCSIYDGSCCSPCDPWLDPWCGGGGRYPLPGTGGGGGFGGGGGGQVPRCNPYTDVNCPLPPPVGSPPQPRGCTETFPSDKVPDWGVPGSGNLCANDDTYRVFMWAWSCSGNLACCKAKHAMVSKKCDRWMTGHTGGNYLFIPSRAAPDYYGNCCAKKSGPLGPGPIAGVSRP